MLKAIILEDEDDSRELLVSYLKNLVELVAVTTSIEEAYFAITNNQVDVAFLDIRIGEEEVFVLFDKLNKVSFEIVFITAYSEYAIRAFELSATAYILKPLTKKKLEEVIHKIEESKRFSSPQFLITQFEQLKRSLYERFEEKKDITITIVHREKNQNVHSFINSEDIILLEADGNQTTFYLKQGKSISYPKNIGHYGNLLPKVSFLLIHKSHLINKREVESFIDDSSGGWVSMSNGKKYSVSRSKKADFLEWISQNN